MIICKNVSKVYSNIKVIDSTSVTFSDVGFYLLSGESGSGKTTFLNVLSGMIPFDSGTIKIGDTEFKGRADASAYEDGYDYITQDTYFVDYLTVFENLSILSDDESRIDSALEEFGLLKIKDSMPVTLSGGERQRLALARSLLTKKKTLFLDEPTASLDRDNKIAVFEQLKKLSRDMLIICATHDGEADRYADQIIRFEKSKTQGSSSDKSRETVADASPNKATDRKKLTKYVGKWFTSSARGKKSDILLLIFLSISMCLCLLTDSPKNKYYSNIQYVYNINSLTIVSPVEKTGEITALKGRSGVIDVVLKYEESIPAEAPLGEGELVAPSYAISGHTIPFDPKSFRLSDQLYAGTFFKNEYDVIISYENAKKRCPDNFADAVGQTMTVDLYGKGSTELKIVGVFKKLNDFQVQYMKSLGITYGVSSLYDERNYQNNYYINSKLTNGYLDYDEFKTEFGKRSFDLYFDNFENMMKFRENYDGSLGVITPRTLSFSEEGVFTSLNYITIPLSILIMLLAVFYYGDLTSTELSYSSRFISVFNYCGYSIKDVKNCFIKLSTLRLLIISVISAGIAFVLSALFNLLNEKIVFIGFRVFTYNLPVVIGFIAMMCVFSVVSVNVFMRRVKAATWYENLVSTRDLL
jgi:ABC-type multidrug transport system ATPase subunit